MKNKIIPILCIFILLSFIFINNNVFAKSSTTTITEDVLNKIIDTVNSNETYLSGSYHYIIAAAYQSNYEYVAVLVPNNSSYMYYTYSNDTKSLYCTIDKYNYIQYTAEFIVFDASGNYKGMLASHTFLYQLAYFDYTFYSTVDIYNDISCTDFFFQTPVTEQPEIIPETVEIPAVETVEQIPTAMVETLKMIIPVGLVVLSVVLLIYLMRRLIYRCS